MKNKSIASSDILHVKFPGMTIDLVTSPQSIDVSIEAAKMARVSLSLTN